MQAANAGPHEVGMVSVHGTGTPLGDPIEIGALGQGLGAADVRLPLAVLSNKSCFGHTEGAAGAHLWHNPEGLACDHVPWLECYLPIVHCSFFRALLHLQISQLYTKAAQTD